MKKRKRRYSKLEKKSFLFVYLFIAIPIIQFLIFWVFVNLRSISLAFLENRDGYFTLEYFQRVFDHMIHPVTSNGQSILSMIGRSLFLWFITNIVALPISLACTYVMYRKVWGHYAYRVIYAIPLIIGSVIWVGLLKELCNGNGSIVYLLSKIGIHLSDDVLEGGLFVTKGNSGFITLSIILFIQTMVGGGVIATSAFSKVPKHLFEAAEIDGVGFWGQFTHVALPCAWPTISTLMTVALCTLLVVDGNVYLFTNGQGYNIATMGFYLYSLSVGISNTIVKGGVPDYGYASAVGITITVISVPLVLLGRKLLGKIWSDVKL